MTTSRLRDPLLLVLLALAVVTAATVLVALGHPVPGWFESIAVGAAFGAAGVATPGKGLASQALATVAPLLGLQQPPSAAPDSPGTLGLTPADLEPAAPAQTITETL